MKLNFLFLVLSSFLSSQATGGKIGVGEGLLLGKDFSFLRASWAMGRVQEKRSPEPAVRFIHLHLQLMGVNRCPCVCLLSQHRSQRGSNRKRQMPIRKSTFPRNSPQAFVPPEPSRASPQAIRITGSPVISLLFVETSISPQISLSQNTCLYFHICLASALTPLHYHRMMICS